MAARQQRRVLTAPELAEIARRTLRHYDDNAQGFWHGTCGHDVSQNVDALVGAIEADVARILDLGCGPGRDLAVFKALGHQPVGLDGSAAFCELAREFSGCEVLHQDFLDLKLPAEHFDGVFANASLFHVPSQELPRVLRQLWEALAPRGVLFCSNPRGNNVEGWNGDRYGAYHDLDAWRQYLTRAGFEELLHYYRPPGKPRDQQPWLASCWRKLAEPVP